MAIVRIGSRAANPRRPMDAATTASTSGFQVSTTVPTTSAAQSSFSDVGVRCRNPAPELAHVSSVVTFTSGPRSSHQLGAAAAEHAPRS